MRFHYTAADSKGSISDGNIEAKDTTEVLKLLSGKGLRPISLKVLKGETGKKFFGQTITIEDKVFLTKYLALMLKAGTDLFKAIDILIKDFEKPALKAILTEIRNTLEKGQPFYITFTKYPQYFSPVFINLVKAGEISGNLESVFFNLSYALGKEQELRNKIKSALIYPIILLSLSLLILLLLVTFSLPKIANIFVTSGFKIPTFSKIVFSTGLFFNQYVWFILPAVILLIVIGRVLFVKVESIRKIFNRFVNKIPVIKKALKEIALQRFASTLSLLMKAGLPILDSLEITAGAVGSDELKESLLRISREGVAKGLTIGEAFRRETVFPLVVSNLIAVSEEAGHTEDILRTLGEFYESEIDTIVKSLVSFLEPILLLFIGIVIGTIALSIIVPMYQLVGSI